MMGARLTGLVLDRWAHLPELQYRALLRMAHTALDRPRDGMPAATYWGGHELLARTWRQPYPDGDTDEDRRRRRTVLREVRSACTALVEAGAIKIVDTGQPVRTGHSQTYRLTL